MYYRLKLQLSTSLFMRVIIAKGYILNTGFPIILAQPVNISKAANQARIMEHRILIHIKVRIELRYNFIHKADISVK